MIRKISIGSDYKNAMHYTKGQPFNVTTIHVIRKVSDNHYEIYLKDNEGVVFLWKDIVNMPCVIEYDLKSFS